MAKFLRNRIALLTACMIATVQPVYADTEGQLKAIKNITYSILVKINQLPAYIEDITRMAQSWNNVEDTAQIIPNSQYAFWLETSYYNNIVNQQITLSKEFTKNLFQNTTPLNANELSYITMKGVAYNPKTENGNDVKDADLLAYAKNYIQNAAGAGIVIRPPQNTWPDGPSKKAYTAYYNTILAIQSFNAYAMSNLYNHNAYDQTSDYLATQASTPDWFQAVATESLGLVLRHILMYQSQSYVLQSRMYAMQQQQLTAMLMSNSILIQSAQQLTGTILYSKAVQGS